MPFRLRVVRLLAATTTVGFTSAFVRPASVAVTTAPTHDGSDYKDIRAGCSRDPPGRSSNPFAVAMPPSTNLGGRSRRPSSLASAKIIPYAFRSASAALVVRAAKTESKMDAAVLFTAALLGYFNFATEDNDRLKSAKRAVKRIEKSKTELSEDDKSAAKTYKSAVRVKIIGQFLSLLWMAGWARTGRRVMLGAAATVSATVAFLLMGGGRFRHNASGRLNPIAEDTLSQYYVRDGSVVAAAVAAAFLFEPTSSWRTVCAGYVAFGFSNAAFQGMAPSSKNAKELKKTKTEEETD